MERERTPSLCLPPLFERSQRRKRDNRQDNARYNTETISMTIHLPIHLPINQPIRSPIRMTISLPIRVIIHVTISLTLCMTRRRTNGPSWRRCIRPTGSAGSRACASIRGTTPPSRAPSAGGGLAWFRPRHKDAICGSASAMSGGSGHGSPDPSKRRNISRSVDGATSVSRATSRVARPASRLNLSISRTRRIAILSVGIDPSKRRKPKANENSQTGPCPGWHHRGMPGAITSEGRAASLESA